MVRKVIVFLVLLTVLSALPITVSAADIVTDISNDQIPDYIIELFTSVVEKEITLKDSYVFYADTYSNYHLIIGELSYNDNMVTGSNELLVYTYNNTDKTFNKNIISNFELDTQNKIIYSNFSGFPDLIERSDYYEIATILILIIFIVIFVLRSIFSFSLRLQH